MRDPLRFTGEWPPPTLWNDYPNWEYALDEEEIEGQDETTLRPSEVQSYIHDDVAYTAGDAILADGQSLPAMLGVIDGSISSIDVFITAQDAWSIRWRSTSGEWGPFVEDWLPKNQRMVSVSLDDSNVFPLRVSSRLPRSPNDEPFRIAIHPDGSSAEQ